MKDINIYLYESLENERIDEGFKDFIRKFAITAAVATSCLAASAKPPQHIDNVKLNKQIVNTEKDLVKFGYTENTEDIQLIIQSGKKQAVTQALAMEKFRQKTLYKNINARIIKTGFYDNTETGEYVVVLYYVLQ